jgi:STE24 endopeptidase
MTPPTILYIIIGISVASYVFDLLLELLNLRAKRTEIPTAIASFYNKEKYLKSLDYNSEQTRFGFWKEGFSFLLSLAILLGGGFGWLDAYLRNYFTQEIPLALAFFGVIMILSDIMTIPFQLYDTFVIEDKYGFNKTTASTFILDKLKGYLLGAVVGSLLISVLIYLIENIGSNFWIWFGLVASAFIFFVNMFYSSLILPLFNKLTPLQEGELSGNI